ncbi:MAG: 2-oxoacid:ferredoxin oxidoreductase subunit beta [Anaerolineae bacterium]|jgi:2-oxoglutarate ferredoxin oxidoreductase subunit beta
MAVKVRDYASPVKPTWCPGCGDYGILAAVKQGLVQAGLAPHEVLIVTGIGCGSKLPDYTRANGFLTLHGRPVPVATGARLANPDLHVITVHGDGDAMGLGMGHFIHAARRNVNLTDIIQNNQIYGLTKGQYSPTSDLGFVTSTSPEGAIEKAASPTALAITAGATFVSRGFAGDVKHLAGLIAEAVQHDGYALVDVLQPCVTFNRKNTYDWYRERVYKVEETGYDPGDRSAALDKALEWGDQIPLGVIYRTQRPTYEEQVPGLDLGPVAKRTLQKLTPEAVEALRAEFM